MTVAHIDKFLTFILLTFRCNYGPISYRLEDKRLCQSKIAEFPTIVYFAPLLNGFPLEPRIGAWGQKNFWGYLAEKEV